MGIVLGLTVITSLIISSLPAPYAAITRLPAPLGPLGRKVVPGSLPSAVASTVTVSHNYGFSAGELVWMDAARRDRQLDDMKAAGASWVRIDMQWYVVQPSNANTYDWSVYDRAIDAINRHNLRALVILDYAPAWAAIGGCKPSLSHKCAPADPQAFATYAAAAAARYTPRGVKSWEIWNEPNSPTFWSPGVDVIGYADLLKATYPAIKQVNINATVITGGLRAAATGADISPYNFIAALYNAGAKPYFDAIGAHPYSYPLLPSTAADANGWGQMLKIHNIAIAEGDAAKKIWITEVGASTGGPHPITEAHQAQILGEALQLGRSSAWVGPFFWYDYKDLGTNRATGENFFGLVRFDGSHKPAYDSFVQAARK